MKANIDALKQKLISVLKKHKVARAGIFGSYARGEQKKDSDIDIVVEISDKHMSLLGFIHIKNEIEEALGKRVDLVEYEALKPRLRERILEEEIVIL